MSKDPDPQQQLLLAPHPDVPEVERLRREGRPVAGRAQLVAHAPACHPCERQGRTEPAVVEFSADRRAVCLEHFAQSGHPLRAGGRVLIETGGGVEVNAPVGTQPIGYAWLIQVFHLRVLPPSRLSFVGTTNTRSERDDGTQLRVTVPRRLAPAPTPLAHLDFALKHEGVDLAVIAAFFRRADREVFEEALTQALRQQPLAQNLRRLWWLYEWLEERVLDVPDLMTGNYIPLLSPELYVTGAPRRARRQRVDENLLGNRAFSPTVRKTPELDALLERNVAQEVQDLMGRYDDDTIGRAVSYLYTKETRSSFGIEGERPNASRVERFVAMLRRVPQLESLDQATFISLQRETVDPRFANDAYRADQVYVGTTLGYTQQRIEYIAPRPEDVPSLMEGLLACLARLDASDLDPVVEAALISFGFVFIHPFNDGNGRLHRLLIHYVLARRGVTPGELIFPISAVMEAKRRDYDACLESFSRPLMALLEWEEDADGVVTVLNDSAPLYRYFDATRMAVDLYRWVLETIETELPHRFDFIEHFRIAREEILEVVDLPDQKLNLFVRLCLQHQGRLSNAKRVKHFAALTDAELEQLEGIVQQRLLRRDAASDSPSETRAPRRTASRHSDVL